MLFYPHNIANKVGVSNLFFGCFHFELAFESIKEFGGVSNAKIIKQYICAKSMGFKM